MTPYRSEPTRLRFTDYELDVSRRPPHGACIVDEDEFQEAVSKYGYSEEFQRTCYCIAREALQAAIYMLREDPHPDVWRARARSYHETVQRRWEKPDSSRDPNFQVAYNALMQLGIFANVLLEDTGLWDPWEHDSLDEALNEVKIRFDLVDDPTRDAFLRDLIARHLTRQDDHVVWSRGTRSALVYWDVEALQCMG